MVRCFCVFLLHKSNKREGKTKVEGSETKRMLRKQKSGYVLGLLLCLAGLILFAVVLWKMWPEISSAQNPTAVVWPSLWAEQPSFIPGIEFRLMYLVILGVAMLVFGVTVLGLSREWFSLAGETVTFECPFCRKRWRTRPDKALVHCPHCRQLVHPKMVEK
jgi:hypothetical protein